jgi:hypothetical protein
MGTGAHATGIFGAGACYGIATRTGIAGIATAAGGKRPIPATLVLLPFFA